MNLLSIDDLSLELGDQPILRQASLNLEGNERVCLIGRNGAGKSTLFKLICGELQADSGEIRYKPHLRISQLQQALPNDLEMTVSGYVQLGLEHLARLIADYQELSEQEQDNATMRQMEDLQQRIEAEGGWHIEQRVNTVLSELDLPADQKLSDLSGGWQRRVSLARALVSNPELLLLDEPTNHLDLASIQWLESRVRNFNGSVLFITHDRAFMQRLATRIVELDLTRLQSWPGSYHDYLRRKQQALESEEKEKELFEKKLAEEEQWIRQGIKARRTRNEGRVRALESMREEYAERQKLKREKGPRIHIESSDQLSGRKVLEMHKVSYGYGNEKLLNGLSLKIMRGDRIGLIGNNGVGKSTLLKLMLGQLEPQSGTVKMGTNLEIAYFDQMRRHLDPERTVAEYVGDGRDYIQLNGKDRHVIGYLRGFLFTAKRAMTPMGVLSGGECNRVILAKIFTRPSNLLILDEPTNDLDVETLDVLEERLMEYPGTLIVVSHDREFLDNVVTSCLVFEEDGQVRPYVGGYSDWLKQGQKLREKEKPASRSREFIEPADRKTEKKTKLSYHLQRELDGLPGKISEMEAQVASLQEVMNDPAFYDQPYEKIQPVIDEMEKVQSGLDALMERWMELESGN